VTEFGITKPDTVDVMDEADKYCQVGVAVWNAPYCM